MAHGSSLVRVWPSATPPSARVIGSHPSRSPVSLLTHESLTDRGRVRAACGGEGVPVPSRAQESHFPAGAARASPVAAMIQFLLLQNRQGKTRLSKYYSTYTDEQKIKMEADIHRIVTTRDPKFTNFVEYSNFKLIYRRYAGLFFTLCVVRAAYSSPPPPHGIVSLLCR